MELRVRSYLLSLTVFIFLFHVPRASVAAAHLHNRRLAEAPAAGPSDDFDPDAQFQLSCEFQGPFPYMASLRDDLDRYRCGAVLVSKNAVLTSASCVDSNRHGAVGISEVFLGGFDRDDPIEQRRVVAIFPHEDFTGDPLDGADLALVKFAEETCLKPVPNIGRQTAAGEQYIVLGFGRTGAKEPFAPELRGANATNFDIRTCNQAFGVTPPLDDKRLCTQTPACNCGSICEGDEGGPLVLRETVLEFADTLMGVMSYATKSCDEEGGYGVHTDIQPFLNWFYRKLQSGEFMEA